MSRISECFLIVGIARKLTQHLKSRCCGKTLSEDLTCSVCRKFAPLEEESFPQGFRDLFEVFPEDGFGLEKDFRYNSLELVSVDFESDEFYIGIPLIERDSSVTGRDCVSNETLQDAIYNAQKDTFKLGFDEVVSILLVSVRY